MLLQFFNAPYSFLFLYHLCEAKYNFLIKVDKKVVAYSKCGKSRRLSFAWLGNTPKWTYSSGLAIYYYCTIYMLLHSTQKKKEKAPSGQCACQKNDKRKATLCICTYMPREWFTRCQTFMLGICKWAWSTIALSWCLAVCSLKIVLPDRPPSIS